MGGVTIATASLLVLGMSFANSPEVRRRQADGADEDWSPSQVLIFECGVDVCDTGVHFCDHSQTYRTCVPCSRVSHHCFSVHQQHNCTSYCMDNWRKKQSTKCESTHTTDVFMWPFIVCTILLLICVGLLISSLQGKFTLSALRCCCQSTIGHSQTNEEQRPSCDGHETENDAMIETTEGQNVSCTGNNVSFRVSNNPVRDRNNHPRCVNEEHGVQNGGYQNSQRTVGTNTNSQRNQLSPGNTRVGKVEDDMYPIEHQRAEDLKEAFINFIQTNGNTILAMAMSNNTAPHREISHPASSTETNIHHAMTPLDDTHNKKPY